MFGSNYFASVYFAQAYLNTAIGIPVWVSPLNHATGINQITDLVFIIPQTATNIHFEIQLDKVNTFDGVNFQSIKSWQNQTGWQYNNGSIWTPITSGGIDPIYIGNQAKFTLQTPL